MKIIIYLFIAILIGIAIFGALFIIKEIINQASQINIINMAKESIRCSLKKFLGMEC